MSMSLGIPKVISSEEIREIPWLFRLEITAEV